MISGIRRTTERSVARGIPIFPFRLILFFRIENALGEFRGYKEKMAAGNEPLIRNSVMQLPQGPGLGLEISEDWLRRHMAKDETWWG